ncbi:MAG: ABC transporter ATP-binding protein [Novosphingobium sp.]
MSAAPVIAEQPGGPGNRSAAGDLPRRLTLAALDPRGVVDLAGMPAMIRRILALMWPYRRSLGVATLATLGAAIASLALPQVLGRAVDQAQALATGGTAAAGVPALAWTAAAVLGFAALRGLLLMTSGYLGEKAGQQVGYDLRLAFFERLQVLGFDYHDRVHTGELITRGMLDLEGVRVFMEQGVQKVMLLAMLLVVGATMMARVDPLMTVLALSFVPPVALVATRTGYVMRVVWSRLQERMAHLTRIMEENLQGIRVVRAFAATGFEHARFVHASSQALRLANFRIPIRARGLTLMQTAFHAAMGLVLWVGARRVGAGQMTVGELTQFLAFMTILQQPVRQIIMIVNSGARAASSAQRLFAVIDRVPRLADDSAAVSLPAARGHLRFEGVSFRYPGSDRVVLEDVTFELAPGRLLGIVGAPGSGKSTLAHLIPRFYDVTAGRITLDGHDVRGLTLSSLRGAAAVVAQDVFLFDSAASANIAYAAPGIVEERIVAAADAARIHGHLAALPEGYATRVGERGVSLSGGQRQRVAIARGLATDPAVLVLDDSLSAVDTATETELRGALRRGRRDKATIVIAHRLSALADADEIIVLDRGRIVERGTHASLITLDGHYAALWRLQGEGGAAVERERVAAL